MSPSIAIVIPTRNRPEQMRAALASCADARPVNMRVIVSDNSTDDTTRAAVRALCNTFNALYIRPESPCSMSDHWDWLLQQASTGAWGSHFTFLTDRMIFRKGALAELAGISERHPDDTIVYPIDAVRDDERPIRLHLHPWTGRVARIPSEQMIVALSRAQMPLSAPLLLNSLVPVTTLAGIRAVYPRVCDSIAPDYSFCLKFLDVEESYLFFDKPLLVQHALARSNGRSFTKGRATAERADFLKNLPPDQVFNGCAPIPEIPVALNTAVHEYEYRRANGTRKVFPPLDMDQYYAQLRQQVLQIEDPAARTRFLSMIPRPTAGPDEPRLPLAARTRRLLRRCLWPLFGRTFNWLWRSAARTGRTPPAMQWLTFPDPESARETARCHMIKPARRSFFLASLAVDDVESPRRV